MEISENTLSLVASRVTVKQPLVVVSRCGEGREFFVANIVNQFIKDLGGTVDIAHSKVDYYDRQLSIENSDGLILRSYTDCNIVAFKDNWKEIANDKSYRKILSCQLNSLGYISESLITSLFEIFKSFTLVKIEVDENNDYDINMMTFGV